MGLAMEDIGLLIFIFGAGSLLMGWMCNWKSGAPTAALVTVGGAIIAVCGRLFF